jgi:PTH1 family peptidyl-tRNA hydrolase
MIVDLFRQIMIAKLIRLFLSNKRETDTKEPMKKFLIVGLGNPGPEYKYTRHNVGFLVADRLADELNARFSSERYAEAAKARYRGKMLIIIKPQTYMNLSGKAVRYWLEKEKIPLENLLVITDDINLPFGQIRLRGKGSHGGHNGLKNIIELLQTQQFPRLRIGIGKDFAPGEQVDYVLGKWTPAEVERLPGILDRSVDAVIHFVQEGLQNTMTKFNRKP